MTILTRNLTRREKLVVCGLFLAKYDTAALEALGFGSFSEAFNVLGYAFNGRPASVKNYRDELDPFSPNPRRGWHKRPLREHCRRVLDEFGDLALSDFVVYLFALLGHPEDFAAPAAFSPSEDDSQSSFAKRLVTGLAAENYFVLNQALMPEFQGYQLDDMTRFGCGYDFRLRNEKRDSFVAVEVKGMQSARGRVQFTPKEYETASELTDRFFLCVVRNFSEIPSHVIYRNPVAGELLFSRTERVVVQIAWQTTIE